MTKPSKFPVSIAKSSKQWVGLAENANFRYQKSLDGCEKY